MAYNVSQVIRRALQIDELKGYFMTTAELANNDEVIVPPTDELETDPPKVDDPDDEVVVSIGEEAPLPEEQRIPAPEWVKGLREKNREQAKRIRELEEATQVTAATKPQDLVEPTLAGCEYDEDKFKQDLTAYHEQLRKKKDSEKAAEQAALDEKAQWDGRLKVFSDAKAALKVKDFEDAEEAVKAALSVTQQGILIKGASNSALVVYALGTNPAKLKEFAAIKDPVDYAFAVAKLETTLKVTSRKAPPPERQLSGGTGSKSGAVDSTLERLRAEAAKSGDMTKVMQYKQQLKAKAK